jgi:hypothetical protein
MKKIFNQLNFNYNHLKQWRGTLHFVKKALIFYLKFATMWYPLKEDDDYVNGYKDKNQFLD